MAKSGGVIRAFSAEQASEITGISVQNLSSWERTGFFRAQFAGAGAGSPLDRAYSFRDLVSLRTLRLLRHEHDVSLRHLRDVARRLWTCSDASFAELKLRVHARRVYFDEPGTGRTRGAVTGQFELLPIVDVVRDVERRAEELTRRKPEDAGRTERHRNVVHNARVIAGTRIPVRTVERFIAAGFTTEQIVQEYPSLTAEDVQAMRSAPQRAA